jgi:hypothetical protein
MMGEAAIGAGLASLLARDIGLAAFVLRSENG